MTSEGSMGPLPPPRKKPKRVFNYYESHLIEIIPGVLDVLKAELQEKDELIRKLRLQWQRSKAKAGQRQTPEGDREKVVLRPVEPGPGTIQGSSTLNLPSSSNRDATRKEGGGAAADVRGNGNGSSANRDQGPKVSGSSSMATKPRELLKSHRRAPNSVHGDGESSRLAYNCICGWSTFGKGHLREHFLYKLFGKPFGCPAPGCDVAYGYGHFRTLANHCEKRHGIKITDYNACAMCGSLFENGREWDAHEEKCPKKEILEAAMKLPV